MCVCACVCACVCTERHGCLTDTVAECAHARLAHRGGVFEQAYGFLHLLCLSKRAFLGVSAAVCESASRTCLRLRVPGLCSSVSSEAALICMCQCLRLPLCLSVEHLDTKGTAERWL